MPWLQPLVWVLNGFLAMLYVLVGHAAGVMALASTLTAAVLSPQAQRRHAFGAALLAGTAALVAPPLLAIFVTLMAGLGVVATRVERFNPLSLSWRVIGGLGLYGMMLWGFALYRALGGLPNTEWGVSYLDAIIHVAVYAYPLGFLALLAQALWVHPPLPASPEDLITTVRTRGRHES